MSFDKVRSLKVSERVFDLVCEDLSYEKDEQGINIDGWLKPFNNCREVGYVLTVDSVDWDNENRTKTVLYVWACEARSSDNILILWSNLVPDNGMFHHEDWENRKRYFGCNQYVEAAKFIVDLVKEQFKPEFNYKK